MRINLYDEIAGRAVDGDEFMQRVHAVALECVAAGDDIGEALGLTNRRINESNIQARNLGITTAYMMLDNNMGETIRHIKRLGRITALPVPNSVMATLQAANDIHPIPTSESQLRKIINDVIQPELQEEKL